MSLGPFSVCGFASAYRQKHRQASWIGIRLLLLLTFSCGGIEAVPLEAQHQRTTPEQLPRMTEDTDLSKVQQCVPVTVGQPAILPCDLPPPPSPLSPLDLRVFWQIADSHEVVHFYHQGQKKLQYQDPAYRNRTRLFTDQLQTGNYSLGLLSVSEHDNRTFECVVCYDSLDCKTKKIVVRVEERQDDKGGKGNATVSTVQPLVGVTISIIIIISSIVVVWLWRKNKRGLSPVVIDMEENQDEENGLALDEQQHQNGSAKITQHQQNGSSATVTQQQQNESVVTTQYVQNGSVVATQHLDSGSSVIVTQHQGNGSALETQPLNHQGNGSAVVTQPLNHQENGSSVVTQPELQQQSGSAASTKAPEQEPLHNRGEEEPLLRNLNHNRGEEDLEPQNSPEQPRQ